MCVFLRKNVLGMCVFLPSSPALRRTLQMDVPANANAGCPGVGSAQAGKTSSCEGCPGQKNCSQGIAPPKPDQSGVIDRMNQVKHKILVMSGKGGVGKSSVTVSLALALARNPDVQVGVLDVDLCGPSLPRMFGVEEEEVHTSNEGWSPVAVKDNLSVMSIAFLLDSRSDAVIWRGPRKSAMVKQFLSDVDWGKLDYLLVDTPPGTSDEHLSIVQLLSGSVDGAILVTTPQEISLLDVRKEFSFCQKTSLPVLGVVENMSGFVCPSCSNCAALFPPTSGGAAAMCRETGIPLLGRLPLDPRLAQSLDKGTDFLEEHGDSPLVSALEEVVNKLNEKLKSTGDGQ